MLGASLDTNDYMVRLNQELDQIDRADMERWADAIYGAWETGNFVYIIGNGGSGTTAPLPTTPTPTTSPPPPAIATISSSF